MGEHDPNAVLAFDVGGTRIKAGVVAGTAIEAFDVAPSQDGVLETITALGRTLLGERNDATMVAIGAPGLADGNVITALPGKLDALVGRDLGEFCTSTFGLPGFVVNDALAYGVGEAVAGAGKTGSRVVVITIGTGVGVACLVDGAPVTSGPVGGGILGGQIPIAEISERRDSNGQWGTIESLCCADRIVDGCHTTFGSVAEVFQAYGDGDVDALYGVDRYRRALIRALVALAHAQAPDIIVVGGGPLGEDSPVLDGVEERVNAQLFPGYTVSIRPSALGDGAALIGLAHLARSR